MGAVLHTLNLRLFPEQLSYVINHAEDQVIIVDASLIPLLARVRDQLTTVKHIVVAGEGDSGASRGRRSSYEELLGGRGAGLRLAHLRRTPGRGHVLHVGHHRQSEGRRLQPPVDLPALDGHHLGHRRSGSTSSTGCSPSSPCSTPTPGGPRTAAFMTGADLVMPQQFLQAEPLAAIIARHRPTLSAGVPTIWSDLLRYAQTHPVDLSSLRMITAGGAAVPRQLIERFRDELGIEMVQGWGMTETSPLCSLALPPRGTPPDEEIDWRSKTGRVVPGVEVRVVAEDGLDPAQRRRVGGGVRGPGSLDLRLLLRRSGSRAIPRRLAAHRGHRFARPARLHADQRPDQGRDQVRGRVDLVGRAGERGDGPSRRWSRPR